jgi:hypothetical protein
VGGLENPMTPTRHFVGKLVIVCKQCETNIVIIITIAQQRNGMSSKRSEGRLSVRIEIFETKGRPKHHHKLQTSS